MEPLSVEVTFRGDAAEAIERAAELLDLPFDRAVEVLALRAAGMLDTRAA